MKFKWECPDCREGGAYRFSHLVGTIFENTKIDLRDWFKVIHLMLTAKKGMSAMQIQRIMGFGSYKTAWYVCHRIRAALQDKEFRKLMGIVEVDETFIGGKRTNKHNSKRGKGQAGTAQDGHHRRSRAQGQCRDARSRHIVGGRYAAIRSRDSFDQS